MLIVCMAMMVMQGNRVEGRWEGQKMTLAEVLYNRISNNVNTGVHTRVKDSYVCIILSRLAPVPASAGLR